MALMGASPKTWSETVVLPLVKYSRAWAPKPPHLASDRATPTQASFQPTAPEWSHFTQPMLSLLIKTIHSGSDAGTGAGRPSIDHEKRHLLKFMWDNNPQPAPSQLSTTYTTSNAGAFLLVQMDLNEDCVLCIRYATGYLGSSLAFNHLQIEFHNQVDCLKFVGIIKTICPCKMSATMESSQDLDYSSQKRPTNTSTQAHLNSRESSSPACEKEALVPTIKSKTTMNVFTSDGFDEEIITEAKCEAEKVAAAKLTAKNGNSNTLSAQKPMQRSPVSIRSQTAPKAINKSFKTATNVTNTTPAIITIKIRQPSADLVKAGCCLRLRLSMWVHMHRGGLGL
ncbi:hypothetical protein O181_007633 [Austropuccinia psidii MF-1]|uniref:Uncharacterized protein n=1 Tax=Austropuccinia psidii MF-1 TaxID=1389203 RepID=A0A9Q3GHS3_9BASI|nr:hypothetical protein [Austropuccinia psidii MF-1]